ncbi:MAG TPA: M13-type metalloendopeptidase [Woeseiaceae bacterium]|nr:M13-type metalloendopeptidase [Woeseiaceae bacterium]
MRNTTFGALVLLLLAGCGQSHDEAAATTTPATTEAAPLKSGLVLENMDKSIRPGDDFFMYMNGAWIDKTEIPADKATYGGFGILNDEAQEYVKEIIEESANGDFPEGSPEQKVGDLYKSYMNWDKRDALGVAPLQPEMERIEAISNYDELAEYFAGAIERGLDAPLGMTQFPDMKRPTHYGIYMFQSGLGLPDREFYFNTDPKSVEIRGAYVTHIEKMFDLAGLPGAAAAAKAVMKLETRLADKNMKKEDTRDWAANYNKVALGDLPELMPNFNWDVYLEIAKVEPELTDGLIVINTDYIRELDGIIKDTDLDTWKTYLQWVAVNHRAGMLNQALDKQNFEFYGKTLSGTEEQLPMWRRAVTAVNGNLGEVVGEVYVKKHFPPAAKERMIELVGNLIKAYEKSITELDWMTDETKAQALDKLSKFKPKIGYPDVWREYDFDLRPDDLYGNLVRSAQAEYDREVQRQGGEVDRSEWSMTPQTVNAYYNPTMNEIVFPAAILQPPFFTADADDAVNYGAIGAVIGHEIGHGFDDSGSKFDGDGVLRNWWTDKDRAEFEKRTDKLVSQYNAYAPFNDLHVNGEYTLGENIGDLGGISIGLLAYKMSLDGKEPPVIDGFTGVQRVFLGYAQVWRNKYRDEALRNLIQTNPHAPSMFRANGAVRNVPEWYTAFDIGPDAKLYLPPEERVKIW